MSECEAGPTMMENDLPHWDPRIMVAMVANCPLAVCDQLVSQNRKQSQKIRKMAAGGCDVCYGPEQGLFPVPWPAYTLGNFRACSTTTISTIIWSHLFYRGWWVVHRDGGRARGPVKISECHILSARIGLVQPRALVAEAPLPHRYARSYLTAIDSTRIPSRLCSEMPRYSMYSGKHRTYIRKLAFLSF
jgi:hypothetical protein